MHNTYEMIRIEHQLRVFQQVLAPKMLALFAPRAEDPSVEEWQAGIANLQQRILLTGAGTLPPRVEAVVDRLQLEPDFVDAEPRMRRWLVSVLAPLRGEDEGMRHVPPACRASVAGSIEAGEGAARAGVLASSARDPHVWNALCIDLPALADQDPEFALAMLDTDLCRARTAAHPAWSPAQRAEELEFFARFWFRNIRHNALVHVVAALANNHVDEIERFLELDVARGNYAYLLPRYTFAILATKIAGIRREDHSTGLDFCE